MIQMCLSFQGTKGLSLFYVETRKDDGSYNNLEIQVGMAVLFSCSSEYCMMNVMFAAGTCGVMCVGV